MRNSKEDSPSHIACLSHPWSNLDQDRLSDIVGLRCVCSEELATQGRKGHKVPLMLSGCMHRNQDRKDTQEHNTLLNYQQRNPKDKQARTNSKSSQGKKAPQWDKSWYTYQK